MKYRGMLLVLLLLLVAGCDALFGGPFHAPWRSETLASGDKIKVTRFDLVWGSEHNDHALGGDCFAIEYVTSYPNQPDGHWSSKVVVRSGEWLKDALSAPPR